MNSFYKCINGYKNEIKKSEYIKSIGKTWNFCSTSGQEQSEVEEAQYICFSLLLWVWVCQWMGYYNNKRTIKIGYDDDAVLFE